MGEERSPISQPDDGRGMMGPGLVRRVFAINAVAISASSLSAIRINIGSIGVCFDDRSRAIVSIPITCWSGKKREKSQTNSVRLYSGAMKR